MAKRRPATASADLRPAVPLRRHRILLVEDDVEQREAVALLLESAAYVVDRAVDGADALDLARARPPHLALVDLAMPGLDGFEVASRLRAEPRTRDVPLIAMTGREISPTAVRLRGPFEDVVFKPLQAEHLLPFLRIRLRRLGEPRSDERAARRILLVEDDVEEREALASLLEAAGFAVDRAVDGPDALELAKARRPALVLADLSMPRMDGYEVARRLQAEARTRDVPLVALTGRHIPAAAVRAGGPFSEVFFKPVDAPQLLAFLAALLE